MKALDIVRTRFGSIGMITETSDHDGVVTASVDFFEKKCQEKTAWWSESELTVIHSLPLFLAEALAHPFLSQGREQARKNFPLE